MQTCGLFTCFIVLAACSVGFAVEPAKLDAVPFTAIHFNDSFWAPRIKINREAVIPHNIYECEITGRISNFAKAGGSMPGQFEGIYFNDSDVYKMLEGAAYTLHQERDAKLEKQVDEIIDKIASAQQPDGYLYTYYTVRKELNKKWTDLGAMHELYCAGHLIEAAIAYDQATGKRKFLDVAIRLADLIESIFGPDKRHDVPGHEEIELALFKLAKYTGNQKYEKLAEFFVEERGRDCGRKKFGEYCQDDVPLRQRKEIGGHAVRCMYFFTAAADLARLRGDRELLNVLDSMWHDLVDRKMYITGGIGPSAHNEGFTVAYDLPNDSAYAETCAAIGMVLWNHRMNLLTGDARYFDVLERCMYNGVISGVGLDGKSFFYTNRLASRGKDRRVEWFGCACCPPNVARILPSVGNFVYATAGDTLYVNLYAATTGKVSIAGTDMAITQETKYPWDGAIRLTLQPQKDARFTVALRIPGWSKGAAIKVNGQAVDGAPNEKGYATIARNWKAGDVVELSLPMPVERVYADPRVNADVGRVAIQRGPVVYCLEQADNPEGVRQLSLPKDAPLSTEFRPEMFTGVTVIKGSALSHDRSGSPKQVEFTAIPYHAWANRQAGQMVVWIAEDAKMAEPKPIPTLSGTARVTASHTWQLDSREALNDQFEPANSNDHEIPRFSWWDRKGTTEWVQYDFAQPARVSSVQVYFFDDGPSNGGCRLPASWRVLYQDGGQWKPVEGASDGEVRKDAYSRITFTPVQTKAIRVEAQLRPNYSGGILEMKVE